MRCKCRKFFDGEPQHIYQRTIGGANIFYDVEDFLVFYTVFSSSAGKFLVNVLELCLMIDHVHCLIEAESRKEMSEFICHYTSVFVKEYNRASGRSGPLFEKAYGSAPKRGDKKIRSIIPYIFNNPVEKKLCFRAEDYRWNFLAYAVSRNPFSEYLNRAASSRPLCRAMKEVELHHRNGWYLKYAQIRRLFKGLCEQDKERLIDYIIVIYSPFDYARLISFYGEYETMLLAVNSVTGSEYDVAETYYQHSDVAYYDMIAYLREERGIQPVRQVTVLSAHEKDALAKELRMNTDATALQIAKFLHIRPCHQFS